MASPTPIRSPKRPPGGPRGRPMKPDNERRYKVEFLVNIDEHRALLIACRKRGQSFSEFMREAGLAEAREE